MNKILNWTVGSFFRTIGRIIAFFIVGVAIAYILSISNIDIPNLFRHSLFLDVKADTFIGAGDFTYFSDSNKSTEYTYDGSRFQYFSDSTVTSATATQHWTYLYINGGNIPNGSKGGYVYIPFYLRLPNVYSTTTNNSTIDYCDRWKWYTMTTNEGVTSWYCDHYDTNTITTTDKEVINPFLWLSVKMYLNDNSSYECKINYENKYFQCPIPNNSNVNTITHFIIDHKIYYSSNAYTYYIGFGRSAQYYNSDAQIITENQNQNTQAIIDNEQQQHEEIMDSNTTQAEDDAEDFFESFDAPDIGGLSAIVTAPLTTIQSLLNATCTNLVLPLPFVNENLTLPCMNDIYTQHFGAFFSLYQTIILGIIAYRCIRSIFFDLQGFANPSDDRIEVMDL